MLHSNYLFIQRFINDVAKINGRGRIAQWEYVKALFQYFLNDVNLYKLHHYQTQQPIIPLRCKVLRSHLSGCKRTASVRVQVTP